MRSDTFFTRVTQRDGRNYERLWVEDSFGRLSRNGFGPGTALDLANRPGVGLVIRPVVVGSLHVSERRGSAVFSLEQRDLSERLRAPVVRVRLCCKSIIVMPSFRLFTVAKPASGVWRIAGLTLTTDSGSQTIDSRVPLRFAATPARLDASLTTENVIFATEIIGNAKPGSVSLSGDELMVGVARQFLTSAGYAKIAGVWQR